MIKRLLLYFIANAFALYGISYFLGGSFLVTGGWKGYLMAGAIIGLVNAVVKPLLKLLSLPFILMTAGLFSLVLNIGLLIFSRYLINDVVAIQGIALQITSLLTYLYVALLLSLANLIISLFLKK